MSHISSKCALYSSTDKTIYMDSNEDKSPNLDKIRDDRLRYLKQPLFAYLNIINLGNKVISLKETLGCLSPDYLVLSETNYTIAFLRLNLTFHITKFELDVIGIKMEEA